MKTKLNTRKETLVQTEESDLTRRWEGTAHTHRTVAAYQTIIQTEESDLTRREGGNSTHTHIRAHTHRTVAAYQTIIQTEESDLARLVEGGQYTHTVHTGQYPPDPHPDGRKGFGTAG